MRAWPNHQLWIVSLCVLPLLSCSRSTPEAQFEPTVEPPAAPVTGVARIVPRRTGPLIITNVTLPTVSAPAAAETNTPPSVTCSASQTFQCMSPDGVPVLLTARVQDIDGDGLSVVWNIDGKDRQTQQVAAGTTAQALDLTFTYNMTPGDHLIRVTAADGMFATTGETTLTIQKDAQPPVIACPADISVPVDPGRCTATVTFVVKATDNCPDVTVTSDPPSGAAFAIGTTPVTCSATDAAGNVASCTFNVTVYFTNRCPQNEGFWRQNPGAWPLESLQLGNQVYTRSQLLPLLRAPVPADASLVLARQLIVATLNTANGSDPRPVCEELTQANNVFTGFTGKLPYRVNTSSAVGRSMIGIASRLSGYNSGLLTANCVP